MVETKEIRDLCLEGIRNGMKGIPTAAAKLEGNHFAGMDVAVDESEKPEIYRIVVIRHNMSNRQLQ